MNDHDQPSSTRHAEQIIGALIPSAALPVGPLPPAPPPTLPTSILTSDSKAGTLAIGVGHLDRSGRVQDRVVTSALR